MQQKINKVKFPLDLTRPFGLRIVLFSLQNESKGIKWNDQVYLKFHICLYNGTGYNYFTFRQACSSVEIDYFPGIYYLFDINLGFRENLLIVMKLI